MTELTGVSSGLLLDNGDRGGRLALSAGGAWTAERAGELERLIERVIARHRRVGNVDIDMGAVERLDTFGAWVLRRPRRGPPQAGGGAARHRRAPAHNRRAAPGR